MAKIPCEHDQSSDIANYIGGGYDLNIFIKILEERLQQDKLMIFRYRSLG